jgi:hypothetical protein
MASDLLERMKRNPAGDWRIHDVEVVCQEYGLLFRPEKVHLIVMLSTLPRVKF